METYSAMLYELQFQLLSNSISIGHFMLKCYINIVTTFDFNASIKQKLKSIFIWLFIVFFLLLVFNSINIAVFDLHTYMCIYINWQLYVLNIYVATLYVCMYAC